MTRVWTRPLARAESPRPPGAHPLAGGPLWFSEAVTHRRGEPPARIRAEDLSPATRARLTAPRAALCGLPADRPLLMGILNVTPDSFSDGGLHAGVRTAVARAQEMLREGADILDIGGESTRPGAAEVAVRDEIARVVPVIRALRAEGVTAPISVDTRKAPVLAAALDAGADLFNDVSALRFDPDTARVAADAGIPVCLMHARGDPATMQQDPRYDDVLADVLDFLEARIAVALDAGIPRARILVDPGIGFGKTARHNLDLIRGLAAFHDLGCPVLLGASRKRFIGTLGGAPEPRDRVPGSIAVALEALRAGVQVLRVHDVAETRQAVALWRQMQPDPAEEEQV